MKYTIIAIIVSMSACVAPTKQTSVYLFDSANSVQFGALKGESCKTEVTLEVTGSEAVVKIKSACDGNHTISGIFTKQAGDQWRVDPDDLSYSVSYGEGVLLFSTSSNTIFYYDSKTYRQPDPVPSKSGYRL